jgi:pimeloyl-ACP methyl ester carboxylesterase
MAELDIRGARLHVQRMGKGDTKVIFVHGFIWDNMSSLYFNIAPPVARIAEVLLYDLRGHGKSECTPTGYTLDDMVEDLVEILRQVGWRDSPVHLVGNSYGGLIAVAFAIKYPQQTAGLVLLDPELTHPEWAVKMRKMLELGGDERRRRISEEFQAWFGRYKRPEDTRLADTARRLVYETSVREDLAAAPVYTDEMLRRIDCPVLAYYGEHSDVRTSGEHLAQTLAHCELRIIPGGSHVIIWEASTRLREEIMEWIKQQSGPSC